ncbi:hypothetical protein TH9_17965 [Thalassospira xiamenensis]|nr:hypothetical protein TH9_17965 [Thalassospira xiamenensis]
MRIYQGGFAGKTCCVGQRYLFGWLGGWVAGWLGGLAGWWGGDWAKVLEHSFCGIGLRACSGCTFAGCEVGLLAGEGDTSSVG